MAAVVEVCAIHLHRLLRVALDQRCAPGVVTAPLGTREHLDIGSSWKVDPVFPCYLQIRSRPGGGGECSSSVLCSLGLVGDRHGRKVGLHF